MATTTDVDGQNRFVVAAFAELSFGLLGILFGWLFGPDPHSHIPSLTDSSRLLEGLVLGSCVGAVLAAAMLALSRLPIKSVARLQEQMGSRLREFLIQLGPVELVVLSMAAGLGEEILFRGWLQQGLFTVLGADHSMLLGFLGLLSASFLFGLAHPISPLYVMLATTMGIVLGGIYWMTGNLLCAIVSHAVYDAIILLKWHFDEKAQSSRGSTP